MSMRGLILLMLPMICASCVTTSPGNSPATTSDGNKGDVESIRADTSRSLLKKFMDENPNAREHVVGKNSAGLDEGLSNPALHLKRVLVGDHGTLLEIQALTRQGKKDSAIMRRDTLRLREYGGRERPVTAFQGVEELRDPQGGSALVAKPGNTLYLLAGPIDDYHPFSLLHTTWSGNESVYFENIDPRFRERYDASFAAATTPEKMKDFLTEFGKNDPDKRAPDVFMRLIKAMRAQNTFEGYYHAYLLMKEPQDAKAAMKLVKTEKQRAMMENMAVATLADKSRLIDFDLKLEKTTTSSGEGSCWLACRYNFSATRPVRGTLTVRAKTSDTPIKLRHGTYRVTLSATTKMPIHQKQESNWVGSYDESSVQTEDFAFNVTLSPPSYTASIPVNMGVVKVAFAQRGSMGGYTYFYATSDASVALGYKNMELVQ